MNQANPADPETFPFILIGNKLDIDGGNSRVVHFSVSHYNVIKFVLNMSLWLK